MSAEQDHQPHAPLLPSGAEETLQTTTAWAHLPNAKLIDWVLQDVAMNLKDWNTARDAARDAALDAARDAARRAARGVAWRAARDATWDAAWGAVWDAVWDAAWSAIAALIADDQCAHLLNKDQDYLRATHAIDGHFSSLLLRPAALIWQKRHDHQKI